MNRKVTAGFVGAALLLGMSGCGDGGEAESSAGVINNAPSSSATTAAPTPSASIAESGAPSQDSSSAAPTDVSSPTDVPLRERGDDVADVLTTAMNGSLGTMGERRLSQSFQDDGMNVDLDKSVKKLYSKGTHSKLSVVATNGDPKVSTKGDTISVSVPVVEGHSLYKPGEEELDGAERAVKQLQVHAQNHPDEVSQKQFTFRVKIEDESHGTLSVTESEK